MRVVIATILLVTLVLSPFTSLSVANADGSAGSASIKTLSHLNISMVNTSDNVQKLDTISYQDIKTQNSIAQYTGKSFVDKEGITQYEYTTTISSMPMFTADMKPIDCKWYQSGSVFTAGNNIFKASVIGTTIQSNYDKKYIFWNPIVIAGGKEYTAEDSNPVILLVDPTNNYYQENTLQWDYGICLRRVRIIEGMIQETFIFDKDPGCDIEIKSNTAKDNDFTYDISPFAYDAVGNELAISPNKLIKSDILAKAIYPVTIDPTITFNITVEDTNFRTLKTTYNMAWNATAADYVLKYSLQLTVGEYCPDTNGKYQIRRSALYFDTSSLSSHCSITSANLSLHVVTNENFSSGDFSVTIQNGQPTYPHMPASASDYYKELYSGDGGSKNSSTFHVGQYINISLNSSGKSWINKIGITKLLLRTNQDINGQPPPLVGSVGTGMATFYSREQGFGRWPLLTVIYTSSIIPIVTTNPVSYLTKTSARLNGYVNDSGGTTCNVIFEYRLDDILNRDFETGDPPSDWILDPTSVGTWNRSALSFVEGTYSGNMTSDSDNVIVYQNLSVAKYAGKTVTFSTWVNASDDNYGIILIVSNVTDNNQAWWNTLNKTWEKVSIPLAIASNASYITIYLITSGLVANGSALFDAASIMHGSMSPAATPLQTGIVTGQTLHADITGLWPNTSYAYRIVATNSLGTTYGDWVYFTTVLNMTAPTGLYATPSDTTMSLSWYKGNNSVDTYINYMESHYPANPTDGSRVCLTPNSNFVQTGLLPGHTYYYAAWAEDGTGNFSANASYTFATTLPAAVFNATALTPPTEPDEWFAAPNGSVLQNSPFYPIGNMIADTFSMPYNTWWFLLIMGFVMIMGFYLYSRSSGNLLLTIGAMIVFIGIFSKMGLLPLWIVFIFIVISLGVSWKEAR
jgi:hypothetical protein